MRFFFLFFVAFAPAFSCKAADQLIDVSSATLDGWTITGTGAVAPSSDGRLVLPAGVQLSRQFSESVVVVHLVARPVFSAQDENWPIFGLGPTAVAFIRQNGQGRLMLVVNEATVIDLPGDISLGSTEKQDPIDLIIAYDRLTGTALVSYRDQVRIFDVAPSASSTEIWLSAGAQSSWPIDALQVLLPDLDAAATGVNGATSSGTGLNDSAQVQLNKLRAALDQLRARNETASGAGTASANTNPSNRPGATPTLEVFTPPSVRRTQVVSAVLNAVNKSQHK